MKKRSMLLVGLLTLMLLGMAQTKVPLVKAEENEDPNLIQAYFEPGKEIKNAVGLRYKFRVNQNQSPSGKIIFNGLAFYNLDTGKGWGYFLENNIFARWVKYSDNQYNCKWPPQGQNFSSQAGFWPAVSDYYKSGLVGVRQFDENTVKMFPRQNSGIDNISGLTKIETISQMNMNGKDVSVEILRGDILNITEPVDGWGYRYVPDQNNQENYLCESKLPPAEYRIWKVISIIDNVTYQHEFLIPESYAKYIHQDIKNFFTEFFKTPGLFQTYFWDIEVLKEDSSAWEPIRKWKVGTSYGGTDSKTNGFKLATYNNHHVIEVSNDGTDTYYRFGQIFELPNFEDLPSITLEEITNIVNQLKQDPPILTDKEKVDYLSLFYDIVKVEHARSNTIGPDGDVIEWKAVEGIRIIWNDSVLSDQLLERSLNEHFAPDSYNFGQNLGWYFSDEILWRWKDRPSRHDKILARVIWDGIIKPLLLRNKNLNLQSELIIKVNKDLNETFQEAYILLANTILNSDPGPFNVDLAKLTFQDREYLFNSMLDLIKQIPYLKQRTGNRGKYLNDPYSLGTMKDPRDRMADLIVLIATGIFDLNPVTNFNNLTNQQREEIKNRITNVYELKGLDKTIWDKFTILINPYYNGEQRFYYNFFSAFPNIALMLEDSRLVYRFGGWFKINDPDNPNGLADGSFPLRPKGGIELGIHGTLHNVSRYQERNEILGQPRIGVTRLNEITNPLRENVNGCREKHLPAQVFGFGGDDSWWCDAPYELWATLANVYMVDSYKTFDMALKGPNVLLDQFLYVLDIFSLKTNTGRFYKSPGEWFERTNRTFDFIEVPITRNNQGFITSLTIDNKKYNFELDVAGNVLSHSIFDEQPDAQPPSVQITQPANSSIAKDTIIIKANASDDKGVNRVEFYIDNTLHSADNTSPYEYSWDTATVPDGLHQIKTKAYDEAENNAEHSITVKVNNTPPPQEIPFQATIIRKTKCQIELRLSAVSPSRLVGSPLRYRIKDSEGKIVKRGVLMRDYVKDRQGNIHYETMDELYLPIAPYTAHLEVEGKVIASANFGDYNQPLDQLSLEIPLLRSVLGDKNYFEFKLKAFSTQQPKACLRYKIINLDKIKVVKKGRLALISKRNKEKSFYTVSHRNYLLELPMGNYQLIIESSYGGRLARELKLGS